MPAMLNPMKFTTETPDLRLQSVVTGWLGCEPHDLLLQVVRKQLVFLALAFWALSAAALLPIALVIARHAAAAAAAQQAPAPAADNNDYTCLGLPDISGLPDMWGQLLVAVRRTAGLAVAQPEVGL